MTIFRSEDVLVGLVAVVLVPWIGWTLQRGFREKRLPIGRTYVGRDERPAAFVVLVAFYLIMALIVTAISLDLLFNIDVRFWS